MGEWGWEPPPPPPIPTLPPPPDEREALLWALFTLLQEGGRKKVQRSRGRVKSWEGEGCEEDEGDDCQCGVGGGFKGRDIDDRDVSKKWFDLQRGR